jgi:hypothetical protein
MRAGPPRNGTTSIELFPPRLRLKATRSPSSVMDKVLTSPVPSVSGRLSSIRRGTLPPYWMANAWEERATWV